MAQVKMQSMGPRKNYESSTSDQTYEQIMGKKVTPKRNLLRMQIKKKRKDFNQPYKFSDFQIQKAYIFPSFKDDAFGFAKNMVKQIGLQGNLPYVSSGSQTFFRRKLNKCLQFNSSEHQKFTKIKDDQLMNFLDNVYPQMEAALQSNETLNIFQDDFDVLPSSNANSNKQTSQLSNSIRQTKNLFYLPCKGKKVSSIHFQPWTSGKNGNPIVAQSFVQNLSFQQRVIFSMKSSKSNILFWNYQDMHAIDPLLILTSPLQIVTFQFNPKDPNIVIAGSINGQILMWDLKGIQIALSTIGKKKTTKLQKTNCKQIQPSIISCLQDPASIAPISDAIKRNIPSHKSSVMCIRWLPAGFQLDIRKSYNTLIPSNGQQINQFASISSDGQVLVWQKKFLDAQKKPVTDLSQFSWKAGFGFHLFRPQNGGQMGGSHLIFKKNQKKTSFIGTSDQGQLFVCDWSNKNSDQGGNSKNQIVTQYWGQQRNYRPIVALDILHSNQDIILTVYDFHFCIWKTDVQQPLFVSSITKGSFHTAGMFSPTRPGVVFIGKSNGSIDIWDFMDQSHKSTMTYNVGSIGISSMRFHQYNSSILAVGTLQGTLHILDLPYTLTKKIGQQQKTIQNFWQRQIQSVTHFQKRFEKRFQQSQIQKLQKQKQQRIKAALEQKKQKREDQQNQVNQQYLQFSTKYLTQFIQGIPVQNNQQNDNKKTAKK